MSPDRVLAQAETLWKAAGAHAADGSPESACGCLLDALALLQTLGPHQATVLVLINLGRASGDLGQWASAVDHFERAVELGGLLAVPGIHALAQSGLGMSLLQMGCTNKALQCFANAGVLYMSEGDTVRAASAWIKQGVCLLRLSRQGEAAERIEAAVTTLRRADDPRELAIALHNLANVREIQGRDTAAADLRHEALELFRMSGDQTGVRLSGAGQSG